MEYKALIIAVDQYTYGNDLPNTIRDANEIQRLLLETPSLFNKRNVQYIYGAIASKDILRASLVSFFNNVSEEDVLFLYWAGHGAFSHNEGYFVPRDGRTDDCVNTMIEMSAVRDMIDHTVANTVISFFDTCHSGAITREQHSNLLRGIEVKGSGKVLIAACAENQFASDRRGHGAFTDYLIRGLEGGAADEYGNINIYNLYSFITSHLSAERPDQEAVINSTLNGSPIILRRNVNRSSQDEARLDSQTIDSSGVNFLLDSIIAEYDECRKLDTGCYQLTLTHANHKTEKALRELRNSNRNYAFAIQDEADIVRVESVDVHTLRNDTSISVRLKSTGEPRNSFLADMSIGSMSERDSLTADQIAVLRVRRILFNDRSIPAGYGDHLVESLITHPQNSKVNVVPDQIKKYIDSGCSIEQTRVAIIAALILTGTLESIEELSFHMQSNVLTQVHLVGQRPKIYSNVDPKRITINEVVNIPLS